MILANPGFTLIHKKQLYVFHCSFINRNILFLFWLGLASDVLYN